MYIYSFVNNDDAYNATNTPSSMPRILGRTKEYRQSVCLYFRYLVGGNAHIYIYIYIYIYICIYVYIYICTYIHICIHIFRYVSMCMSYVCVLVSLKENRLSSRDLRHHHTSRPHTDLAGALAPLRVGVSAIDILWKARHTSSSRDFSPPHTTRPALALTSKGATGVCLCKTTWQIFPF